MTDSKEKQIEEAAKALYSKDKAVDDKLKAFEDIKEEMNSMNKQLALKKKELN